MTIWRSALLASMLSGVSLGAATVAHLTAPHRIDALAASLDHNRPALERALSHRVQQLQHSGGPRLAAETLDLLAPLADRAGLAPVRAALEDASFRILEPQVYEELAASADPRGPLLKDLLTSTQEMLHEHHIEATVTGRSKSLYSTWRKMQRKDLSLHQVYDQIALRIQVQDVATCDQVIALVHERHTALPAEYDDYIRSPKPNGYQSLHTVVRPRASSQLAEFQVRTYAMHAAAEGGEAAHWRYKLEA